MLEIDGNSSRTTHKKNTGDPVWNERCSLHTNYLPKFLKISAMDHDFGTKDDLIGMAEIDVSFYFFLEERQVLRGKQFKVII